MVHNQSKLDCQATKLATIPWSVNALVHVRLSQLRLVWSKILADRKSREHRSYFWRRSTVGHKGTIGKSKERKLTFPPFFSPKWHMRMLLLLCNRRSLERKVCHWQTSSANMSAIVNLSTHSTRLSIQRDSCILDDGQVNRSSRINGTPAKQKTKGTKKNGCTLYQV